MSVRILAWVAALAVLATSAARADGVGWWYYSFSPTGFERYFGGGNAQDRALVEAFVRKAYEDGSLEAKFGLEPTPDNLEFWLSRTRRGLSYRNLSDDASLRNDELLHAVMSDRSMPLIEVRPETPREYLQPQVLEEAWRLSANPSSSVFRLFEFGRSVGEKQPRRRCLLSDLDRWWCELGYVVLSPGEVRVLHTEVQLLLARSSALSPSARTQLAALEEAVRRVVPDGRSLYFSTNN